ncbi:MAG: two-component regulator propeller domain-containing protein, partial [Bacteroidota bacterium]
MNIRSLFVDRNGNVWVGTESGIAVYEQGKFRSYTSANGLPHASISGVTQDPAGIYWIATYGGGILRFDGITFTSYTVRDGLSNNTVLTIAADETGTIWAGTGGGGVNRLRDGVITVFSETEGLCNNVIVSILKDSDGDLWFGSSGGGVSRLDGERFVHFTEKQGKLGNWIYAIYQDDDGSIWFGNSFGGVTRYDGKIYTRYSEKDNFTAGKVKCIVQDRKKRLWFGTVGNGAFVYEHGIFRHLDAVDGMRGAFVNAITEDAAGDIWFACSDAGIIRYREPGIGDTARRFLYLGKIAGLGWMRVYDIFSGDNNEIWAGTDGSGLLRVRDATGPSPAVTIYTTHDGLSSNTIRTIARDSSGNLLFGTGGGGLIVRDGSGFRIIRKQQGISSNNIYSLVVDRDRRIWLGTEKGIDRIMMDGGRVSGVKHYGKAEGITGVETTQNATCLDREGNIWFGTIQGAIRYDPRQERPDSNPPKTHIKEIRLFFDDISTTHFVDSLAPWYPIPVGLILPYNQNHLSFDFVGIGQRNPEAVCYQWKMDGLEREWSPRSAEHTAVYSNLPPGSYTFTVRSYNEDGVGGAPEEFHFTIRPPFWGTWWFTTLAVLVTTGGIIGVFIWRLRAVRLKGERERHDIEMRRDIVELQQKSLRLSMNPHFIFNALNSIQAFITDSNPAVARRYLSRFARLMRLILENSRETNVSLAREIDMLTSYLELERLNLNNSFEYSIEISPEIDPDELALPPMLVQPFVENAVIHGVRRRGGGGIISIAVAEVEGLLRVSIADNGIGRGRSAEFS